MHLVVLGVNHKTAPVSLRERLSIGDAELPNALKRLSEADGVRECLILSTCNRTEVYACTPRRSDDAGLITLIGDICGVSPAEFAPHLYRHPGHKAAEHLFRVASGIDSMVLGEAQILGQVKNAYAVASATGATGPVLNTLFQQAITVGKRARTETAIGCGSFSVGSVAVQLAKSIFEELKGRTVLIVGAGKISELTIAHLSSSGADRILVTNRTHGKAEELAARFGGSAVRFEEMGEALARADIVIASTGADRAIITRQMVESAMHVRRGKPMFLIDIAVPRDIESSVQELDDVFVYNIDDLQSAVEADAASRQCEVAAAERIIREEVEQFTRWFRALDAVPIVTALRTKAEEIRSAEMEKLRKRLPDLTPEQLESIEATTRSIVNRICHNPVIQIKEYAACEDADSKLETVCELFGICPPEEQSDRGEAEEDRS